LKIGIDGRALTDVKTGIGQYAKSLLKSLTECAPEDEFIIFSNKDIDFPESYNCHNVVFGRIKSNLWLQTVFPYLLDKYKVDILHSPMFLIPIVTKVPSIITVHDMVHEVYRKTTNWKNYIPLKVLLANSMEKVKYIIADSENTKMDIIRYSDINPNKIRVVYLGCDQRFKIIKDISLIDRIKIKYHLPEHYILTVSTLEPRKNMVGLFHAFNKYLQEHPDSRHKLVVVGAKGWNYKHIFFTINEMQLHEKVIFTDYVLDDDLPVIYNGADVFIFPSFYEGFGLPPLEAMSCGIPIICSNAASLPEVVGQAGILFEPHDSEKLCSLIAEVLLNETLRKTMVFQGLKQAQNFSWTKAASETISIYKEVYCNN